MAAIIKTRHRAVLFEARLVNGDHDGSKPSEREAVARLVTGSRVITLADTGHFASLEHPGEVARILINATTAS